MIFFQMFSAAKVLLLYEMCKRFISKNIVLQSFLVIFHQYSL